MRVSGMPAISDSTNITMLSQMLYMKAAWVEHTGRRERATERHAQERKGDRERPGERETIQHLHFYIYLCCHDAESSQSLVLQVFEARSRDPKQGYTAARIKFREVAVQSQRNLKDLPSLLWTYFLARRLQK